MFSSRLLRSRVFLVATTLIHVRWRSTSSTPLTTSSTKYLVGLKCPPSLTVTAAAFGSSMAAAPLSNIASRYPLIHSFPAIVPLKCVPCDRPEHHSSSPPFSSTTRTQQTNNSKRETTSFWTHTQKAISTKSTKAKKELSSIKSFFCFFHALQPFYLTVPICVTAINCRIRSNTKPLPPKGHGRTYQKRHSPPPLPPPPSRCRRRDYV